MKLLFILKSINNSIRKMSHIELDEIKTNTDINTHFFCSISSENYPDGIGLNLSLLLLETNIGKLNKWDDLLNTITDAQIDSYQIQLPGYTTSGELNHKQIKVISPLNTHELDVGYTNIKTPTLRNIKEFKETLLDLVISKKENIDINFKNCISSVNGVINFSYEFENELLIKDGAKCIWGTPNKQQPAITLLDFSNLGNAKFIKFSECTPFFRTHVWEYPSYKTDIEINFPINFINKTIFMVLNGTLYFPDEIDIISDSSILLTLEKTTMHSSIILNNIARDEYITDTSITYSKYPCEEYFKTLIWEKEHFNSFFIVIDTPGVSITRSKLLNDTANRTFKSVNDRNGILINKATKKIAQYVRIEYEDHQVNYKNKPLSAARMDHPFFNRQISIPEFRSVFDRNNIITNYQDSSYELIHVISNYK